MGHGTGTDHCRPRPARRTGRVREHLADGYPAHLPGAVRNAGRLCGGYHTFGARHRGHRAAHTAPKRHRQRAGHPKRTIRRAGYGGHFRGPFGAAEYRSVTRADCGIGQLRRDCARAARWADHALWKWRRRVANLARAARPGTTAHSRDQPAPNARRRGHGRWRHLATRFRTRPHRNRHRSGGTRIKGRQPRGGKCTDHGVDLCGPGRRCPAGARPGACPGCRGAALDGSCAFRWPGPRGGGAFAPRLRYVCPCPFHAGPRHARAGAADQPVCRRGYAR